jgi:hypothetical protein
LFDFALFLCFKSNARVPLKIGGKKDKLEHSVPRTDQNCT